MDSPFYLFELTHLLKQSCSWGFRVFVDVYHLPWLRTPCQQHAQGEWQHQAWFFHWSKQQFWHLWAVDLSCCTPQSQQVLGTRAAQLSAETLSRKVCFLPHQKLRCLERRHWGWIEICEAPWLSELDHPNHPAQLIYNQPVSHLFSTFGTRKKENKMWLIEAGMSHSRQRMWGRLPLKPAHLSSFLQVGVPQQLCSVGERAEASGEDRMRPHVLLDASRTS